LVIRMINNDFQIIQGGMGVCVSGWILAKAVSLEGQLGVVSGIVLDVVLVRRLQDGDEGGDIRRALKAFPNQEIANQILEKYFIQGGKSKEAPYKQVPMYTINPSVELQQLTVVANFVEVWLAKEGHDGVVGINFMQKLQMPLIYSIYGALLAGVDYIIVGAGIPWDIPVIIDRLLEHKEVSMKLYVQDASPEDNFRMYFDPKIIGALINLRRPKYFPIVSSYTLALSLMKKSDGKIDGFVIEGYRAGGHNAPPRGPLKVDESGEPIYGLKDEVDLEKFKSLDVPFYLAGSYGRPEKLKEALGLGASGVQVGSLFAFCKESGLTMDTKSHCLDKVRSGNFKVFTDPLASPTGFPFKVFSLEGTLSEESVYQSRERICDLGYLRTIYKKEDGSLGYRCAAEPIHLYIKKGGKVDDIEGRKCLCNGLISNIGLGQVRQMKADLYSEPPIITTGADLEPVLQVKNTEMYTAKEVINFLL